MLILCVNFDSERQMYEQFLMTILFDLRVFAWNLLRRSQRKYIFSYFHFNVWPEVWTVVLRLISQHTTYLTTATSQYSSACRKFFKMCYATVFSFVRYMYVSLSRTHRPSEQHLVWDKIPWICSFFILLLYFEFNNLFENFSCFLPFFFF